MPIYYFKCPNCSHQFSDIFPMKSSDGKSIVCPKCGKKGMDRVYKQGASLVKKTKSCSTCPTCPTCSGGTCSRP